MLNGGLSVYWFGRLLSQKLASLFYPGGLLSTPWSKKMTYLGPNAMLLKFYHVRPLGDQCVLEITNDVSIFLFVVILKKKIAFI